MSNQKKKVALIISHPIQHFTPKYESWATAPNVEFKVFFASALGYKKYYDPNFKTEVSWGNIRLENFNHIFLNGEEAIPSDASLDAPSLNSELEKFKPDVIVSYGYFQALQRRAYRWANANKVPLAYISDSEFRQRRPWYKELAKFFFLFNYFRKISYFLTVGNANEYYYNLHGVGDEKVVRMHFPIDLTCYQEAFGKKDELREAVRSKRNIAEDELVISVVGKLVSWKNQDHLIDALALLEQRGVKATAIFLGSGEMMEAWQKKAQILKSNRAIFAGFIGVDELPAYYAATDIYVHPASVEPHSIAVSEAIYMGCPIIISDRCGSYGESDDVQPGKNGWVYKFGQIDELSDRIQELARNPEQRRQFGNYSHKISSEFQTTSHFTSLQTLVEKI